MKFKVIPLVVGLIFGWALVEIYKDATYIKEEPQTFIVPREEMLIFKAGYFMGVEAGIKGGYLDSAWVSDSTLFYNKFFKLKTKQL